MLAAGLVAVAPLAGCRTAPTVAAYVGEEQIGVAELDEAVDARLADPAIADYAAGQRADYTRQVLSLRIDAQVYAEAADRLGVAVRDGEVRERIATLLGGSDPDAVYAQVAQQQGATPEDVFASVRQELLRQRIADAAGRVDLSEAGLRARYEELRPQLQQVAVGFVTVPDQATAQAVLTQLVADPASYPAVAAQYPGQATLPQVQTTTPDQLAGPLAEAFAATPAGQGFTLPVPEAGGVVVGFVAARTEPSFAEVRGQLAEQAGEQAGELGAEIVAEVREELDPVVNPRYGVLEDARVVRLTEGVVQPPADGEAVAVGD
ncbi:peptidyl-prolyl cis-trans isomerase SurA [Modestobacter roseus]|uniref:Peptidyl-prolyl cis-trans isomerase SurA n=1 Tax=Modestobacter roseus TaxID=1181884 RepID=A0A562IKL0_9ACTN|nr:peptidyl-prolyl cis-trans isomerase SurA [Modestobacter roseus]